MTPRVNANGLITLEAGQEVQRGRRDHRDQQRTLGPTITERRLQSSVTVEDGETIALGGLIQDTNSVTRNGIPLLSDNPGDRLPPSARPIATCSAPSWLVLLSPKIVHNAADARAATDELRSRLHSLQSTGTGAP